MVSIRKSPRPADTDMRRLERNAMRLLVCDVAESRQAAEEITAHGQWQELFALCAQWKVLSGLEMRLVALGTVLSPAERSELSPRTQPAFVQTMLCIRAGTTALSALGNAGIRCAAFKGLATLAYLYPGPRHRTLQDVDILIDPSELEAALTVLAQAGFTRSPDVPWDEYLAFLRNSPGTAGNEAVSLRDERGGAVDLHWRLGGLDVQTLLADACLVDVLHRPVSLVCAGHAMLLSVHHALRNDFVPGDIARDVSDFVHWQALLTPSQWQSLSADAERWGLSAACIALAGIVAEMRGVTNANAPPLPVRPADAAAGRRLTAFYFHQLATGTANTDLAYVASTRPLRQVVSGLSGGWTRYRDLMRRAEESNGEISLTVHGRLWKLGKALIHLSPSNWMQIRTLARAKDRMSAPDGHSKVKF